MTRAEILYRGFERAHFLGNMAVRAQETPLSLDLTNRCLELFYRWEDEIGRTGQPTNFRGSCKPIRSRLN